MYSGPLSHRIMAGLPRHVITCSSARLTREAGKEKSTSMELLSNVVYGVGQAAFLSDSSSTWTPSLNFTLFTTNVSSTNPLSRFHFFCAASSSL